MRQQVEAAGPVHCAHDQRRAGIERGFAQLLHGLGGVAQALGYRMDHGLRQAGAHGMQAVLQAVARVAREAFHLRRGQGGRGQLCHKRVARGLGIDLGLRQHGVSRGLPDGRLRAAGLRDRGRRGSRGRLADIDGALGEPFRQRNKFMARLCERAGVKPFGFHALRHKSAAIIFVAQGLDAAQILMGHSQATTTNIVRRKIV